jgi:hypothetical protein
MPLDVGELLGDADSDAPSPGSPDSQIQMLAGDGEFTPDSDSMLLHPDPLTGELQFPMEQDGDDEDSASNPKDKPDRDK